MDGGHTPCSQNKTKSKKKRTQKNPHFNQRFACPFRCFLLSDPHSHGKRPRLISYKSINSTTHLYFTLFQHLALSLSLSLFFFFFFFLRLPVSCYSCFPSLNMLLIFTHIFTRAHARTHIYILIHTYYTLTYSHSHLFLDIFTHSHIHACAHTHTHTHTHAHTHIYVYKFMV